MRPAGVRGSAGLQEPREMESPVLCPAESPAARPVLYHSSWGSFSPVLGLSWDSGIIRLPVDVSRIWKFACDVATSGIVFPGLSNVFELFAMRNKKIYN